MSTRTIFFPLVSTAAMAALMGTTLLVSPLTPARADPAANAALLLAQAGPAKSPAAAEATSDKPETVEQRITNLHTALKITPAEEPKWTAVAQAMRESAVTMEKLVAKKRAQTPQTMTALDDLRTYQEFAKAHVDRLKKLIPAFKSLYDSMPDAQKKNTDEVFDNFGREHAATHGQG